MFLETVVSDGDGSTGEAAAAGEGCTDSTAIALDAALGVPVGALSRAASRNDDGKGAANEAQARPEQRDTKPRQHANHNFLRRALCRQRCRAKCAHLEGFRNAAQPGSRVNLLPTR